MNREKDVTTMRSKYGHGSSPKARVVDPLTVAWHGPELNPDELDERISSLGKQIRVSTLIAYAPTLIVGILLAVFVHVLAAVVWFGLQGLVMLLSMFSVRRVTRKAFKHLGPFEASSGRDGDVWELVNFVAEQFDITPPRTYVVDDPTENAAIAPVGNQLICVINEGLLHACTYEEVAGIVGHEFGHYVHRDPFSNILRVGATAFSDTMLRMIRRITVPDETWKKPSPWQVGVRLVFEILLWPFTVPSKLLGMGAQRKAEQRADLLAVKHLGTVRPLLRTLERWEAAPPSKTTSASKFSALMSTHPAVPSRTRLLEEIGWPQTCELPAPDVEE